MNIDEIKPELIHLMKRHNEDLIRLEIFQYEFLNHPAVKEDETIENMAYRRGDNGGIMLPAGHITDKTPDIAELFAYITEKTNNETLREMKSRFDRLNDTWRRFDFYSARLPARQREVIRLHYYEGMDFPDVAENLHLSESTVKRAQTKAVETLCVRYLEMNIRPDLIGDPVDGEMDRCMGCRKP